MECFKIIQNNYKIYFFQSHFYLNINIKVQKKEEKAVNKFKPFEINLRDNFNDFSSNFEDFIKHIKEKNIIILLEEILDINKILIKYLNFKLIKKDSNETKELISKKIYALNIEYYLTKNSNHKRINSLPFLAHIKNDFFNIEDIIDLLYEENILQIYNIDEYKYFNNELGCFIDIKDDYIKIKEKLILEFHISGRKNIIKYNLNQTKKYFDEEIITMKYRIKEFLDIITKYDLIFLYASPIIKNENFEELNAPISYMEETREIIKLMNYNGKKLNLKFECANDKIFEDILRNNRTKILHISAHGAYNGEYSLVLENLEKNGQIFELNMNKLKNILNLYKDNISQMDLVFVSTCYSQDLAEYFKECGAKNVIYILRKTEIIQDIDILFTKYFYKNLFEGKSIKKSFENAKIELESNDKIKEINFNSCCCNHYHKKDCLSHKYDFHNKHNKNQDKIECFCRDKSQPNFHNKNCKYYNDFIKYLDNKSIDKDKIKINEEEYINKICCCDLNIEHNEFEKIKFDSRLKEYENIKFFKNNKKGKSIIKSTLSFYYNYKKYNSIKGRRGLMGKIFSNIINNGEYVILFGEKNLGKIDFTESLCVFLYERKKIKSYKIFRIYSEIDFKYMECILNKRNKYNNNTYINKFIIIIKFDNENDIIN